MAKEEENTQKCSGSGNSGIVIAGVNRSSSFSKKQKQKKLPQRGLGVAQLEKIRQEEEEEQNKKHQHAVVSFSPSSCSATTMISTSSPSFQNKPHFSSLPFSPTIPLFRLPSSLVHNNVDAIWQPVNLPKSHNFGDFGVGKESFAAVDHSLAYGTNNPIWHPHPPGLVQRPQQHLQLPCSPLVSVSSTNSTSSVLNFQMEPPSNQSFGSNYTPARAAEEEKMVRLKRPYPFSHDNPPGLTINCKRPTLVQSSSRSDESTSGGNGGTKNLEPSNCMIREGLLCPSTSRLNPKQNHNDNGATNGDFLTLALPKTSNLFPDTHFKNPLSYLPLYNHELPDVEPPPYRGTKEDLYLQPAPSGSNQHKPYYSFFPPPQGQCSEKLATMIDLHGSEEAGNLDLELKL